MSTFHEIQQDQIGVDEAFKCENCGNHWYYTPVHCQECDNTSVTTYTLTEGELLTTTTVHVTPPDVRSPNHLGVASFDGVQLVAQLDDEISSGARVVFGEPTKLRETDDEPQPRLTRLSS